MIGLGSQFLDRRRLRGGDSDSAFTLLELLVVIGILAVVATGAVIAYSDIQDKAEVGVTQHRMASLRDALLRFRMDMGHFPGEGQLAPERLNLSSRYYLDGDDPSRATPSAEVLVRWAAHPMNFWMLFEKPVALPPPGVDPSDANTKDRWTWDPQVSRGWRGPYLNDSIGLRLQQAGTPAFSYVKGAKTDRLYAIADAHGGGTTSDSTHLLWTTETTPLSSDIRPERKPAPSPGTPIAFIISRPVAPDPLAGWAIYRLVSAGPDRVFGTDDDMSIEVTRRAVTKP